MVPKDEHNPLPPDGNNLEPELHNVLREMRGERVSAEQVAGVKELVEQYHVPNLVLRELLRNYAAENLADLRKASHKNLVADLMKVAVIMERHRKSAGGDTWEK
jgi:hypothetical protein